MFEQNQKTIFVLDHTRYFSIASEDYISMDFLKGKPSVDTGTGAGVGGASGLGTQFSKSLWTCACESSIEYCRVVWDLFPGKKHVRFIVSDTAAHIVNTWSTSTQNMSHVMNAMVMVGVPSRSMPQSSDYSVIHGLRAAIEALAEPTDEQLATIASGEPVHIPNEGRVICITSARDNTSMKSLEDIFNTVLIQQNALAGPPAKKGLAIDHCHLVILNIVPLGVESLVTNRGLLNISPLLDVEIHTVSAPDISHKLTHLILDHYNLASTTVTNIPMKEEQNANSSANYDVEILHSRSAHSIACGPDFSLPTSIKPGATYETVTLKWCTPRGCGSADLQPCLGQFLVTPVDVTSRPSSCLINFLLNGRSVLLEMPRKAGSKATSHMLSARGGEIFIHSLCITRSCMDEAPAIGDGPGGRVTDYRTTELGQLMKMSRMVPLKAKDPTAPGLPRRMPRYFPLTNGSSILFHLQRHISWMPHFLHLLVKEDMDKQEEVRCQQHIHELYKSASRGDMLPFTHTNGARLKLSKAKDQYRLLYRELEQLIHLNATTVHHKNLLESLQSLRAAYGEAKSEPNSSLLRSYTESPHSPERLEPIPSGGSSGSNSNSLLKASKRRMSSCGQRSLLDIISSAERSQANKRLDFSGRLCTPLGQVAKLYPDFGNKEKDSLLAGTTAAPNVKEESIRS
ncbi:uncharacterized protein Dana_GF16409 [Drosophila ananassae]|uniref:Protein asunder n=1 Tax=Drosophila ananassae TaxID=7217 RepID=INT13_DROAN|nr:protein asunder [Drosophila ananassae]B3LVQ1.1 RecName: Full=Protein asunder; AltName: Full=Cell cycle regulator Mat89Bb; AltName: Full=Maternal transcript 89Bb; AltName: Full=Set apart in position or space protein [Drosophila ananassae]EDV43675.1 uncharacterized protein Dana_GF16409 [Drosophila ananassae]KAH8326642.1 hypothetical protein KR067_011274 [Drosophila pandora]